MGKTMRHLNLICFLCLLDVLHGYNCPSSMLLKKNCTVKILHCLPVYPNWTKYVLVCSVAKSFVSGTCPVYFKVERLITSVPCPPIYYTDEIYRSNQKAVPKLKQNCTEEGQQTLFTNSTVNNQCYCVEDYSFQSNDTYCDPTFRNCTCHRNTTGGIHIDASSNLWNILGPVVAVTSGIVLLLSIAGLRRKCRKQKVKISDPTGDEELIIPDENNESRVIDVTAYDIIANTEQSYSSIQATQDEHHTVDCFDTQTVERLPLCSPNYSTDIKDNANSTEMDLLGFTLKPSGTIILNKIADSDDL
ncbi:uncharacterized protein LOC134709722 [Mytilus trossulus]|uniref:uncharacterized protein LOC134709722 n=1 Tax=Mytilus trossulus TaxID=6551 RepID=UPI0030069B76